MVTCLRVILKVTRNGYGVYTWNNGDSYSGNWLNGKKHGYGEFRWASGTMWKGEWRNGEQYKGKTYWNQKKVRI